MCFAIFCYICYTLTHHGLTHPIYRLQLKRGLFWYRHHPKMHEMVSDRSSGAKNCTDLRKMSMRVFFDSKNVEK